MPGDHDAAFASAHNPISFVAGNPSDDAPSAVAIQPDGKIVVAGACKNPTFYYVCIVRLNKNGSLDTSFNTTGKLLTYIGPGNDNIRAMAIQADGKILVAGSCDSAASGGKKNFCLARYTSTGALDTTFVGPNGTGYGRFHVAIGTGQDYLFSMALLADGRIMVAGTCGVGASSDFCVARFTRTGGWDTTLVGPDLSAVGRFISSRTAGFDYAIRVLVAPDNSFYLVGHCSEDFCIEGYNDNGTNNALGTTAAIGPSVDYANSAHFQPDGKVVAVGECENTANQREFCFLRKDPNVPGLDGTFRGPAGNGGGKFSFPLAGADSSSAYASAMAADGKIVVVGGCYVAAEQRTKLCLARINQYGVLDPSFDGGVNGNGQFIFAPSGGNSLGTAVTLEEDGGIIVASTCTASSGANNDFCVNRFQGDAYTGARCTMDIDGDGAILATTDGLLFSRAAMGLTGTAVTNGVTFGAAATRTDWDSIRDYLNLHCGMRTGR
jgi:uncharacterized delta-60 repeat protein